jgi:hypothetical protein
MKTLYIPKYDSCGDIESWSPVAGRTLREIFRALCGMLSAGGRRMISAYYEKDARTQPDMVASLYEGQDKIYSADGRLIYTNKSKSRY